MQEILFKYKYYVSLVIWEDAYNCMKSPLKMFVNQITGLQGQYIIALSVPV